MEEIVSSLRSFDLNMAKPSFDGALKNALPLQYGGGKSNSVSKVPGPQKRDDDQKEDGLTSQKPALSTEAKPSGTGESLSESHDGTLIKECTPATETAQDDDCKEDPNGEVVQNQEGTLQDETGDALKASPPTTTLDPLPLKEVDVIAVMFPKNTRFVVRLRGLPWSAREHEIESFFVEERVREIQIVYLTDGRASGEALVEFLDMESFQSAFLKNRTHIGHRYIEIFKSTAMEIDTAAGRACRPPVRPPQSNFVIRMRGLPYTATDEDVSTFFGVPMPTGSHLIKDDLGRPSGEGFVEFACEVDAIAAMAKHRHHMGHRYIELFRSSPIELMRALGLTSAWQPNNGCSPHSSKNVLMRGLPYSCTESDITKFFQEIEVTPIRIHRKADGAEAYVEFCSVADTDHAMSRHRSFIGSRYIELFRVSYEDMANTVGLPVESTNIPASAFTLNANNMIGAIPNNNNNNNAATTTNAAASAVNQAQSMVNQTMCTNLAIPPLSITPHYGSMAQHHYPSPPQPHHGMPNGGQYGGQYGGRYMPNPLLSATNVANSLLSGFYGPHSSAAAFRNLPSHGNYDGISLCANGQYGQAPATGYYPSSQYYQ